jgi:hypothetical protein
MKKITLRNNFHNTSCNVVVSDSGETYLSRARVSRIWRKLCGCGKCTCSGSLGTRGTQDVSITDVPGGVVIG